KIMPPQIQQERPPDYAPRHAAPAEPDPVRRALLGLASLVVAAGIMYKTGLLDRWTGRGHDTDPGDQQGPIPGATPNNTPNPGEKPMAVQAEFDTSREKDLLRSGEWGFMPGAKDAGK